MTKSQTNDFTKAIEAMFAGNLPDMSAFGDATKNATDFSAKLSKIALTAAEKNAELTNAWTQQALAKLDAATKVQADPAAYAKLVSDMASEQAKTSPEQIAAFAEIAKKAQEDTVELVMAAGKEIQAETVAAVKKATS